MPRSFLAGNGKCDEIATSTGMIPFPTSGERSEGGHAMIACGFDDRVQIKNQHSTMGTTGALLIRNSWGTRWGNSGFGWIPYEYVLRKLAIDWWTLIQNDWIDTGMFKL